MTEPLNRTSISRAILFSFLMNLVMVALAFGFAVRTRSNAILLDGFFSLIGVVEILAVRAVSRLQWRPQDARHPFGFAAFMPLLNATRGLLTLGVCAYAGVAAVLSIIDGGEQPVPGAGVAYGVLAAAGCLVAAFVVHRVARSTKSPLLEVDAKSWWIDGFYSVVVAFAFLIAMLLEAASFDTAARYVDPVLVLVLMLLAIPWPIGIVMRNLRELLLLAPKEAVRNRACEIVERGVTDLAPDSVVSRVTLAGGGIYVMTHLLFPPERGIEVGALDEVRRRVTSTLKDAFGEVELDLLVTAEPEACALAD